MKEQWDLYDAYRNKLDRVGIRGEKLSDEEYHLVVNSWIMNNEGKFLISRRSENKTHPLMWEATGGSALRGDSSLDAALREVKEELGITLDKTTAKFIGTTLRYYKNCPDILDVWLFRDNTKLEDVVIQKEEVCDVKWATKEEILELYRNNQFEATGFFLEAINSK